MSSSRSAQIEGRKLAGKARPVTKPSSATTTGDAEAFSSAVVTEDQIETAFRFFQDQEEGGEETSAPTTGCIAVDPKFMRSKLKSVFRWNMTASDMRLLTDGKTHLTVEDFREVLLSSSAPAVGGDAAVDLVDPVAEAFKCFDPSGSGYAHPDVLWRVYSTLGYGDLTQGEMEVLIEKADADGDGKISLEDFRNLICRHQQNGLGGK